MQECFEDLRLRLLKTGVVAMVMAKACEQATCRHAMTRLHVLCDAPAAVSFRSIPCWVLQEQTLATD